MLRFLRWSWCALAVLGVGLSAAIGADGSGASGSSKDDSLPPGARAQLGQGHFRHSGQVFSFAFSPDSKKLVTTSVDGVHIWDLSTGREIRTIKLEGGGNGGFGPGGGPVPVPRRPIFNVASQAEFSSDGKFLAVAMPGRPVTIYDPETGKQVKEVTDAAIDPQGAAVRFSPDAKQIVVMGRNFQEKSVKIYNVESGKEVRKIEGHDGVVYGACFSNDGKRLVTASEDATIRIWNIESGKEERALEGHRSGVLSVAMSADGKYLASAGNDFTVRIWNAGSGELLHTFANMQIVNNGFGSVNAVQFSSDGKAVVASTSTGVYQWDPASGKELQKPKEGTQAAFFMSAVSPDGKYLARFSWNVVAKVEVFDTKTQTELFPSDAYQVLSLAVSPNSKVLATGCSDKVIRLWDLNTAKELRKLEGHTGAVGFVFFTPDGKSLISAARDNSDRFITIWDLQNGKERKSIRGGNMLQALALSGDGHTLAYKYQDPQGMMSVCLMDLSGGKEIRKIQQVGFNQSVALSPDGKQCVYQDQKGETVITDVAEGKNTKTLLPGFSQGFVFAPDGSSVAVPGQDGLIHLIDAITGTDLRSIGEKPQGGGIFPPPPGGGIGGGKLGGIGIGGGGVANPGAIVRPPFFNQMLPVFSVDGRMVATNGPSGIALWEVATGKQRQIFSGAEQNINVMAFAPDGKTLVSSSVSGQVIFWDLAGLSKEEKAEADKLTAKEAEQLWQDLQGDDGAKAWHAIKVLRAAPKVSVTLLGDKLKPAEGADAKKIDKLIADLDAEGFDQRSKASAELEKLGEQAEAALRKAQKANPSAEAGKSIDELLQKLHGQGSLTGDKLRAARALEVLEQANSDDAAAVLKKLAAGADGWTTDAAKASLERIKAARE